MIVDVWAQFSEEQLRKMLRRKQPDISEHLLPAMSREELITCLHGSSIIRLREAQIRLGY